VIDTIFVPRGAEERAVRRAIARAHASVRVIVSGIGPHAAARAAEESEREVGTGRVLVTGLCGLLSSAFVVGDALVYRDIRHDGTSPLALDPELTEALAGRVPGAQTGIRAAASDSIVTSPGAKAALGRRFGADAVDMESYALAEVLGRSGARVAVVRVGSDAVHDHLPELDRALDGSGGFDGLALALAMLRRPLAGLRLASNGMRALRALERVVYTLVAPSP
jgi:nucleoside phosphorylase